MRVRLRTQQRHESPCASSKFQGMGCPMMGGESDDELKVEVTMSMDEDDVSFVDGVLEGALGALGFLNGLQMEALGDAMDVDNG
ncbi:hypothetical protein Tco_0386466 [Tanacetum coccineum]